MRPVRLLLRPPYDFTLSARVSRSFVSTAFEASPHLRFGVRFGIGTRSAPASLDIGPGGRGKNSVEVSCAPPRPERIVDPVARWVLADDLDLRPFDGLAREHPKLGPIVRRFRGLKPTRPASLLELAVIVITEQQISLLAARRIQERLIRRFGDEVKGTWVFPPAGRLAEAPLRDLRRCGLSHRKAEYIRDFALGVATGEIDLEGLKELSDDKVRKILLGLRGWGPWSTEYFLLRGLVRPDALPADDLGIQRIVGKYLGRGPRASSSQVERLLEPLRPFRGISAFYLFAQERLAAGDPQPVTSKQ